MFYYFDGGYEHDLAQTSRANVVAYLKHARRIMSHANYRAMLRASVFCRLTAHPTRLP